MTRQQRLLRLVTVAIVLLTVTGGLGMAAGAGIDTDPGSTPGVAAQNGTGANATATPTATTTPTSTPTPTETPTSTTTSTPTETETTTSTATPTETETATETETETTTSTPTSTDTPTPTPTETETATETESPTNESEQTSEKENATKDDRASASKRNPKISSRVASLVEDAKADQDDQDLITQSQGGTTSIRVVVEAQPGRGSGVANLARQHGGDVETRYEHLVQVKLPAPAVEALADSSAVRFVRTPRKVETHAVTSEGLSNMNVTALHALGITGENITVAVVDTGFNATNPEIADNVVAVKNMSGGSFQNSSGQHGTAVSELVVDTAPNASLILLSVTNEIDILNALAHVRDNTSADVGQMSLGISNGPFDGTSTLDDEVETSVNAGTPWVISAGNQGDGNHYNTTWSDPDGNGAMNFSGSDELLGVVPPCVGCVLDITVSWDDYPTTNENYDVALYNASPSVIASSTTVQSGSQPPEERIRIIAPSSPLFLAIINTSANGTAEFQIHGNDQSNFEYNTSVQSLTRPATEEKAITVGAVHHSNNVLEPFSSRGPTTDGRRGVDLVAPDGVSTSQPASSNLDTFFGTSAAAPHTSGVVALLLDANEDLTPAEVEGALNGTTTELNGTEPDIHYGHGLVNATGAVLSLDTIQLSDCTDINQPGRYVLDQNISKDFDDPCIYVSASDVILDGQGHTIEGSASPGSAAVFVEGTRASPVENVTVTNLTVEETVFGVGYENATASEIEGVTVRNTSSTGVSTNNVSDTVLRNIVATGNQGPGVFIDTSTNVSVHGSNASANDNGAANTDPYAAINVEASADVTVTNTTASNNVNSSNDVFGVAVTATDGVMFQNVTAAGNGDNGVGWGAHVEASNVTIAGSNLSANGNTGINLINTTNATVTGSEVSDNGNAGIWADNASDVTVTGSTVSGNLGTGVNFNGSTAGSVADSDVVDNGDHGVWVNHTTDVTATGSNLSANGDAGLDLNSATDVWVSNSDLDENTDGVRADGSTNLTVTGSSLSTNGDMGLNLVSTPDTTVEDSDLGGNANFGVRAEGSTNLSITGTSVSSTAGTGLGVNLVSTDDARIEDSQVDGNVDTGIWATSSTNLTLRNVSAENNANWAFLGETGTTVSEATNFTITGGDSVNFSAHDASLRRDSSPPPTPSSKDNVGPFIFATNTSAGGWLNLTVGYDGSALSSDANESTLRLWRYDGTWTEVAGTNEVDTTNDTVTANVTSFSTFTLLADETPDVNVTTAEPVAFGDVNVGELSPAMTVTIENNGSAPLNLIAASLQGPDTIEFDFASGGNPTPQAVQPGNSRTFEVELLPSSTGPKTAYLNVSHNVTDRPPINVTLTGTGVTPNVSVVPSSHGYGDVHVNTTETRDVNVTNTGTAPLNVSSATVSGAGDFALNGSFDDFVLSPGQSQNLTVDFTPTSNGAQSATLDVDSNATDDTGSQIGTVSVSLSGTGVGPNVSVAPASIDFGNVSIDTNATDTVNVSNNGSAPLDVTDVGVAGGNESVYSVNVSAFVVPAGGHVDVKVTFNTSSAGEKNGTLVVSHNASGSPVNVSLSGTGVAPSAKVTPTSVAFGNVSVGDTPTRTVSVENDGTAPLDLTSVSIPGASTFAVTSGGPTVIQPGNTQTVTVEFAPSTTGAKSANLTLAHNASGSPVNVSLSGSGVAPDVNVTTAAPVDFGEANVAENGIRTRQVAVENNGSAPLDLTGWSIDGKDSSDFSFGATPTVPVQPGDTATFDVQFQPPSVGAKTAYLNVTHNVSGRPAVNVTLTGTGVAPNVSVVPSSHAYGDVHVNTTATRDANVTNTGTAPLNVSTLGISGTGSDEFALNGTNAPFVLDPGQSRNVSVDFAPTTNGAESATLTVGTNATNDTGNAIGPVTVSLSGTGVGPNASVTPSSIDFGNVSVDANATDVVNVSNNGSAPLHVAGVSVAGENASTYSVNRSTFDVPAGGHGDVQVTFNASSAGEKDGTLVVSHNASAEPSNVSLTGTGLAPVANVTPVAVDFGNQSLTAEANESTNVTVTNDGTIGLDVTGFGVEGSDAGAFEITAGNASTVVAPGDSHELTVEFGPDSAGSKSATLAVSHNGTGGSPTNVALSGNAVEPVAGVTPSTVDYGDVDVATGNESATVTVTNGGDAWLNVTSVGLTGANASNYSLGNAEATVLAPGGDLDVTVYFDPDEVGELTANLTVYHNGTNASPANTTLTGMGVDANAPVLADVSATDETDGNGVVTDGDQVTVDATVTDQVSGVDNVTVDASAFGAGTVDLTNESGSDQFNATFAVNEESAAADGDHSLVVEATDGAGNQNSASAGPITLDTTNATVTITTPTEGGLLNESGPTVAGTFDDVTSGVDTVEVSTGSSWSTAVLDRSAGTWSASLTGLSDGNQTLAVRATDNASNVGPNVTANFTVDTLPPVVENASLASDGGAFVTDGDQVTVSADVTDATSGVDTVTADASAFGAGTVQLTETATPGHYNATFVVDATSAASGSSALSVDATDLAGNEDASTTGSLTLDVDAPSVEDATAADAGDGDGFVNASDEVTVGANVTDAGSGVANVTADASDFGAGTVVLTDGDGDDRYDATFQVDEGAAAGDGAYSLTVTAVDNVNLSNATGTHALTLDTEAPTVTIAAPANGSATNRTWVRVNATASDALSGVDVVQVDDSGWTNASLVGGTWTYNVTALPEGSHSFDVRAVDNASNVGPVETVTVTVDTKKPTIAAASLNRTDDVLPESSLGVAVDVADATAGLDDVTAAGQSLSQSGTWWNGTVEADARIGNRTLSVRAVDAAGNVNTTSLEYRVGVEVSLVEDNGMFTAKTTDTSVRNVTINATSSGGSETVRVGTSKANPKAPDPPGDVNLYFPQINVSIDNSDIVDATVTVEVARDRVSSTNADLDTVSFYAYNETTDSWETTSGTLVAQDGTHLTYEVVAPHFSTYAITADTQDEADDTGGGGGGSSGSSGTQSSGTSVSHDVTRLDDGGVRATMEDFPAGRTAYLWLEGGVVADRATFERLQVTLASDRAEVGFTVRPRDGTPPSVSELRRAVPLGFVDVEADVDETAFEEVVFRFTVDESSLPEGASMDDVVLYRFHGGEWTALETTRRDSTFLATSPGLSTFAVGVDTADVSVTAASLDVETVEPGEPAEVSVTLENRGQNEGTHTVELLADGAVVATTDVTVTAGETKTVTMTWTPESAASYEISVNGEPAGRLDVQEAAATPVRTTAEGETDPGFSGVMLVVIIAALVVIGVALYAYRRRSG